MADNGTAGSAPTIAWDDIGSVAYQRMKVALGPDGTWTADLAGRVVTGSDGALYTDNRAKRTAVTVTPTVSTTPAYTAKDCVGSWMTFANAARFAGGSGVVSRVNVVDKSQQMKDLELWLFVKDVSGTSTATDNTIFNPADSDLQYGRAIVPVPAGSYGDLSTNSLADVPCYVPFVCDAGTSSLFGVLIARGTPTYVATTDIVVTLTIDQD